MTFSELPPEFTKKIEPLTVTAGEEKAFFEIELSKGDAITKWFKNGKEVELSDRVHVKIDGKKQRLEVFIFTNNLSLFGGYFKKLGRLYM